MRKIYEKYLYVPEQDEGKLKEKVFFARLTLSIICMAFCMFAMGYNAYAYFTANIESTSNVLQAATYSFDVAGETVPIGVGSFSTTDARYKFILQEGTYDFVLTKTTNTTATTGYARIDIGGNSFYTQQIGGVYKGDTEINSRIIRITVDAETVVQFVECWGTYIGNTEGASDEERSKLVITDVDNNNRQMLEVKSGVTTVVAHAEPSITNNSSGINGTSLTSGEDTTIVEDNKTSVENETKQETSSQKQPVESELENATEGSEEEQNSTSQQTIE